MIDKAGITRLAKPKKKGILGLIFSRFFLIVLLIIVELAVMLLPVILLFVPLFGNGTDRPSAVSLIFLDGVSAWIRVVFFALIGLTVLNGLSGSMDMRNYNIAGQGRYGVIPSSLDTIVIESVKYLLFGQA